MILASELLDLIDASHLSFSDIGGVDGAVETGVFGHKKRLAELLKLLDGLCVAGELSRDILYKDGFDDIQIEAVFALHLVTYDVNMFYPTAEELMQGSDSE